MYSLINSFFLGHDMHNFLAVFLILFTIYPQTSYASDKTYNFEHDGYDRIYTVHTPNMLRKEGGFPVVMVFHGGGGNAEGAIRQTSMNETADKYGFIAVYPEGIGKKFHTWNANGCCGEAMKKNVDDSGYVSAMIDRLKTQYNIDEKRIYATGLSNGGMISYRLGCDLSDKIAAIAPVAAPMIEMPCNSKRAVPTIHFHGAKDSCAKYEGGEACGGCFNDFFRGFGIPMKDNSWPCLAVRPALEKRAQDYACNPDPSVSYKKGDTTCYQWGGCKDNSAVALCVSEGAGHTWPSGNVAPKMCQTRPDGMLCKRWKEEVGTASQDIDANEAMWEFFKKHSL